MIHFFPLIQMPSFFTQAILTGLINNNTDWRQGLSITERTIYPHNLVFYVKTVLILSLAAVLLEKQISPSAS